MYLKSLFLLVLIAQDCWSQDEDGPYRGKFIGKLNSYHHQVSGDVYAVDDWTILLVNFNYDGTGDDTFFWAGDSGRPGPQGFILPDQHGKTNILERYYNQDVRLTLPEGKKISRLKWLAVYDIGSQNTFGDVAVPDDFEAPEPKTVGPLVGNGASSGPVQVLDAATFLIPEFKYDGKGKEVYFWTGVGPQPSPRGIKIPDEFGYLEPLGRYAGEDVRLRLAGGRAVSEVRWLAVWDAAAGQALATVLLPDALNVPPELTRLHTYRSSLPNCKQLHRDFQVSWEKFGNQITIELAAKVQSEEYMAFGVSGSGSGSRMVGADVAVARWDPAARRGLATDYNISDTAPCVQVLGAWRGVCRDEVLGGSDSNQVFTASQEDGLTRVSYRRELKPFEALDREWVVGVPAYVVWAVGRLDPAGEPGLHRLRPRGDVAIMLEASPPTNDCFNFTVGSEVSLPPWETAELFDPSLRVFTFRLGPSGGPRGLAGRGRAPALAWYVNGQLAPDLQLRRGLQYTFKVYGGNNPHSATEYHPLIVTAEPGGGLERLPDAEQRKSRVLAGVHTPRRARLAPTAAGPLCLGRESPWSRRASLGAFRGYNRSLQWRCPPAAPAALHLAPNSSWPDLVYYESFTHYGMGGRIFVVDRHRRNIARKPASAATSFVHTRPLLAYTLVACYFILF